MPVDVQTDAFEGPLDLLLHLIQAEELPITEVSLSTIAEQYIQYLQGLQQRNPENLSEFLVVAAQLLLIKSRALLPQEEQEEVEDVVDDLTKRLELLAAFREAGSVLGSFYTGPVRTYEPRFYPPAQPFFSPGTTSASSLKASLQALLAERAKEQQLLEQETLKKTVTVEETLARMQSLLNRGETLSFTTLLSQTSTKAEIIVTFLSTLELMKQHQAIVLQQQAFSDIIIKRA